MGIQLNLFNPVHYKVRWRFRAATLAADGSIESWSSQSYPAEDRNLFTESGADALKQRLQQLPNYAGGFEMIPQTPKP